MSRMLQIRDQILEHEGPAEEEEDGRLVDDDTPERVGLLGLRGVEEEGGLEGRCRTLESLAPLLCNTTMMKRKMIALLIPKYICWLANTCRASLSIFTTLYYSNT